MNLIQQLIKDDYLIPVMVNKEHGKRLQQMAFRHGFKWKDGNRQYRHPTGDNQYFLFISFKDGEFYFIPKWDKPDHAYLVMGETVKETEIIEVTRNGKKELKEITKVIETASENADRAFGELEKVFREYAKELPEFGSRRLPKQEIVVKYPTIVRRKYDRYKKPIMAMLDLSKIPHK